MWVQLELDIPGNLSWHEKLKICLYLLRRARALGYEMKQLLVARMKCNVIREVK